MKFKGLKTKLAKQKVSNLFEVHMHMWKAYSFWPAGGYKILDCKKCGIHKFEILPADKEDK